ncbi:MAG: DNA oxidative demethylase AlkB [Marinobacter sp.]|nr:DNA oxidative demethylase AlkB [Marinobacter sp.]
MVENGESVTGDLFGEPSEVRLGDGAHLLKGFALAEAARLLDGVRQVAEVAPFRIMHTPGGKPMSAAMTGCGSYSWVSDRAGYRYSATDPQTGQPWPAMPADLLALAQSAAAAAGYPGFTPDVCLINRYEAGSRMGLHQDKDERDLSAPIVSVSLGLPMTFLWGGHKRNDRPARLLLEHGDVVVWGGPDRLRYHGVAPLKAGSHPLTGGCRINLTFRRAV